MTSSTLLVALGIGLIHTVLGPDHYLPFIVIGRARKWGLGRTLALTLVCGLGHVGSSVLLGLMGAAVGSSLVQLQDLEAHRGELAGWSLLLFGGAYGAWGLWRALRHGTHGHAHLHVNGTVHVHPHHHDRPAPAETGGAHEHGHETPVSPDDQKATWRQLTPWILFLVFVLGPCEPLIPLFFADAVLGDWNRILVNVLGYTAATLAAMLGIVSAFWLGLRQLRLGRLERFSHAIAGGIILLAGVGMVFLGL